MSLIEDILVVSQMFADYLICLCDVLVPRISYDAVMSGMQVAIFNT